MIKNWPRILFKTSKKLKLCNMVLKVKIIYIETEKIVYKPEKKYKNKDKN